MKICSFLVNNINTGDLEHVQYGYRGNVPPVVFKRLNRRTLKLHASGYFFPLDTIDAYQEALVQIESTQQRIDRGELVLNAASSSTYLFSVGNLALLHFHQREVTKARATYRAVERTTMGIGAVGEDGFDIDNYDGTQDQPDKAMCDALGERCESSQPAGGALTAQQLVEQLPGWPDARERVDKARSVLEEICAALLDDVGRLCSRNGVSPERIIRAFRAYVLEDGHFPRAAKRAKIGINCYYAEWPLWTALAKAVSEKITVSCH